MKKKYLQTVNGTPIKPLRMAGDGKHDAFVFIQAYPEEASRSFVTHISAKGIHGGVEAVQYFLDKGEAPELPSLSSGEKPAPAPAPVPQQPTEPTSELVPPQMPVKRKRGRPRKHPLPENTEPNNAST